MHRILLLKIDRMLCVSANTLNRELCEWQVFFEWPRERRLNATCIDYRKSNRRRMCHGCHRIELYTTQHCTATQRSKIVNNAIFEFYFIIARPHLISLLSLCLSFCPSVRSSAWWPRCRSSSNILIIIYLRFSLLRRNTRWKQQQHDDCAAAHYSLFAYDIDT